MNNLCINCQRADMCLCKATGNAAVLECERYTPKQTQSVITFDVVTDGLKHDGGKPRLDLVPAELIEAVGAVMTHGAEKYGAEWWLCEGGGYICSNCGCFFDDHFAELPMICERCNSAMTKINMEYEIDTSNRLVIGLRSAKEDEIPYWLKEQQKDPLKKQ